MISHKIGEALDRLRRWGIVCLNLWWNFRDGGWNWREHRALPPPTFPSFYFLISGGGGSSPLLSGGGIPAFFLSSIHVHSLGDGLIITSVTPAETPCLLLFLRYCANTCRVPKTALVLEAIWTQLLHVSLQLEPLYLKFRLQFPLGWWTYLLGYPHWTLQPSPKPASPIVPPILVGDAYILSVVQSKTLGVILYSYLWYPTSSLRAHTVISLQNGSSWHLTTSHPLTAATFIWAALS